MMFAVDNWLRPRTDAQYATQILAFSQCQLFSTECLGGTPCTA
jgi:hypothetical protein